MNPTDKTLFCAMYLPCLFWCNKTERVCENIYLLSWPITYWNANNAECVDTNKRWYHWHPPDSLSPWWTPGVKCTARLKSICPLTFWPWTYRCCCYFLNVRHKPASNHICMRPHVLRLVITFFCKRKYITFSTWEHNICIIVSFYCLTVN